MRQTAQHSKLDSKVLRLASTVNAKFESVSDDKKKKKKWNISTVKHGGGSLIIGSLVWGSMNIKGSDYKISTDSKIMTSWCGTTQKTTGISLPELVEIWENKISNPQIQQNTSSWCWDVSGTELGKL